MNKRILSLLLALAMILSLAACGGSAGGTKSPTTVTEATETEAPTQPVEVEENLLTVEVTIPASLFSDMTEEGTNVTADDVMSATLTYGGKYEYSGFSIIEEESRSDFTYSNITSIAPLSTEYLHYLFQVPGDVTNTTDPITIDFSIAGYTYTYTVR